MSDHKINLISSFNVEPLGRYLTRLPGWQPGMVSIHPYGQVHSALTAQGGPDGCIHVVWTMPQHIIPSFAAAYDLQDIDHARVLEEVDAFADTVISASATQRFFLATWTLPVDFRGYGLLDWRPGLGIRGLVARMNSRLADRTAAAGNVHVLDSQFWFRGVADAEQPKMWYAAKVPYAPAVFENAASDIAGAIDALEGRSRRVIVLDLDGTLWGGVVGEIGWKSLRLGGHDHAGEAYKDFQRELKAMSARGIQLAVVSKNDEAVALEAIDRHPEMLLRRSDLAGWRINWEDKASNIMSLAAELNLGLSSLVFIDDNPAERSRVAGALPDVLVPDWSGDPTVAVQNLRRLNCFNSASIGNDDRGRTHSYVANRSRAELRSAAQSQEDWLRSLGTTVRAERVSDENISRVAQLMNKTNQLNLSTRRLSEAEIKAWADEPGRAMLAFSVTDRFGDLGLIGVVGVERRGAEGRLIDFVLSCRAMGRKIEETLLHVASSELARMGASEMVSQYLPTARNRPTVDVFRNAALPEPQENIFRIGLSSVFPKPGAVELVIGGHGD